MPNPLKFRLSSLMALAALMLSLSASAQTASEPRLYYKGSAFMQNKEAMLIRYEVNTPGFVELHLFNAEGKKVWIKGKVSEKLDSEEFIPVPVKPLESGKRYSFILKYKGKEYSGNFYAP
jgi:hypothetical protein